MEPIATETKTSNAPTEPAKVQPVATPTGIVQTYPTLAESKPGGREDEGPLGRDPFIGMMADEPELMEEITEEAMKARETRPLRSPGLG